jgi:DNA-binding CsgD family transcriptional regulator
LKTDLRLTPKEEEVLRWLSEGKSTSDIASILAICSRTVKFHISNILRKLNAENRTHAVVIALDRGLIKRGAPSLLVRQPRP